MSSNKINNFVELVEWKVVLPIKPPNKKKIGNSFLAKAFPWSFAINVW